MAEYLRHTVKKLDPTTLSFLEYRRMPQKAPLSFRYGNEAISVAIAKLETESNPIYFAALCCQKALADNLRVLKLERGVGFEFGIPAPYLFISMTGNITHADSGNSRKDFKVVAVDSSGNRLKRETTVVNNGHTMAFGISVRVDNSYLVTQIIGTKDGSEADQILAKFIINSSI